MPAVVASGTVQNGYTLTINRPANVGTGDLLIASVSSDGTGVTLGAPGGWVLIGGSNSTGRTIRSWYKIATNGEPASYTFTSSSTNAYRGTMLRVTGAPTSDPILAASFDGSGGASNFTVAGVSGLSSGGALQIAPMTANANSDITFSTPSGWSSLGQVADSNVVHMPWRTVSGSTAASQQFTTNTGTFSLAWGSIFISSGQVVSISRTVSPQRTLVRGPFTKVFAASVTAAGVAVTTRVVVRLITRTFGGGTSTDAFLDDFSDSFVVTGAQTPGITRQLVKTPRKTFERTAAPWGGYAKVTQKVLTAVVGITGFSRRTAVRRFTASITPQASLTAQNIGRLFGVPGVVDITVRLAGEIRARIRRR